MEGLNQVQLIANLGKDPLVIRDTKENEIVKFSLATPENYQDKEGNWQTITEWHNVSCFKKVAKKAMRLSKGSRVHLIGKLKTNEFTNREGVLVRSKDVVCQKLIDLTTKKVNHEEGK